MAWLLGYVTGFLTGVVVWGFVTGRYCRRLESRDIHLTAQNEWLWSLAATWDEELKAREREHREQVEDDGKKELAELYAPDLGGEGGA